MITTRIEAMDLMSQLSKGSVAGYVAGLAFTAVAESPNVGSDVYAIAEDDTHVFVGTGGTGIIRKYLKSDLSYVAQAGISYGGPIHAMVVDDTHLFVVGDTTQTIRKYLKSDLSYVGQSAGYGGDIYGVAVDDNYVYVAGTTVGLIKKYNKSDLSYVTASPVYTAGIFALAADDTHVYIGGGTPIFAVRKYLKTDLSYVATAASYGGNIYTIAVDGTHVYAGGAVTQTIRQYLKSDMSYVDESADYGGTIQSIVESGDYVYAGGNTTQTARRYAKSGMGYVDETAVYGGTIAKLATDDDYVYLVGIITRTIRKYSLFDTVDEIIDALLAYPMQNPAVTKGTIASAYADAVRTIQADGQSIQQILLNLRSMLGGYMEVNNDRELDWAESIGEDKGQQIRYRKNLLGITKETDYTWLVNRVYAYGRSASGERISLSDIQDEDYVEDTDSQTEWGGIFSASFVNHNITSAYTLLAWAEELLEEHKDPYISYRISAIDLSTHTDFDFERLQLGSQVTIIDEELGIDVSATVVRIEHPNLANPQEMNIEVANVARNIGDTMTELSSTQRAHGMLLAGS